MRAKDWLTLAGFIALCEAAGIIGSLFVVPALSGWYATLIKPPFAPPNWLFGPVWIILYLLMGIAVFLVWRKGPSHKEVRHALGRFALQLALNTLWPIIFFGVGSLGGAFFDIFLLWFVIVATIIAFSRISQTAAWLLAPYLVWVSYALILNFMLWNLNYGN